jgi:hypothetical protein
MIKITKEGVANGGYQIWHIYNDDVLMNDIDGKSFTTARGEGEGEIYDFSRARRYALGIAKVLGQTQISIKMNHDTEPVLYHVEGGGTHPASEPLPNPLPKRCCGRK